MIVSCSLRSTASASSIRLSSSPAWWRARIASWAARSAGDLGWVGLRPRRRGRPAPRGRARSWKALRTRLRSTCGTCMPRCGAVRIRPSASRRGTSSRMAPSGKPVISTSWRWVMNWPGRDLAGHQAAGVALVGLLAQLQRLAAPGGGVAAGRHAAAAPAISARSLRTSAAARPGSRSTSGGRVRA